MVILNIQNDREQLAAYVAELQKLTEGITINKTDDAASKMLVAFKNWLITYYPAKVSFLSQFL